MKHSGRDSRANVGGFRFLGENLAGMNKWYGEANGVKKWYDEIKNTNGGRVSSFGMNTGHYTQVVWKETTDLGCAVFPSKLLVCQYGIGGNMRGQFNQNVNGPVKSESQCANAQSSPSPRPPAPPAPAPAVVGDSPRPSKTPARPTVA